MSSIGSAIQSAFTPHGTNAADAQQAKQAGLTSDYAALLQQLFPSLQQEQNFSNSLVPQQEADASRMLMLASPGNQQARTQLVNNAAYSNAAQAAQQADQSDAAAGLSPAITAGQNQGIANHYQQMINSPQYQLSQAQNLMGQLSQAQQLPGMGELQQLTSGIYGAPQVQIQPGLGQFLGSIAGDYAGGLGKAEGSGSSGGNSSNAIEGDAGAPSADNPYNTQAYTSPIGPGITPTSSISLPFGGTNSLPFGPQMMGAVNVPQTAAAGAGDAGDNGKDDGKDGDGDE